MKPEPAWRRYLRFWGSDAGSDVDDELGFHLEMKVEELVASGWPPERARREALRQFGPVRPVRGECYRISQGQQLEKSRLEYWTGWWHDVRYAARALWRTRASTVAAAAILALGIGANTAVFTLLDRLLYRPLPVPHPSQLLFLSESMPSRDGRGEIRHDDTIPYSAYLYLRDHNQAFSGLAGEANARVVERRKNEPIEHRAEGRAVTGNYFATLGVNPLLGRTLAPSDDGHGPSRVAVASYRFWTRRFGQSPAAVGQTVYVNDAPFTIVGVLPREFFGLHNGSDVDLYLPIAGLEGIFDLRIFPEERWLRMFGRLRPGTAPVAGQANLQTLLEQFAQSSPFHLAGAHIEAEDGSRGTPGAQTKQRRSLGLLAVIVGLLLLMGCANVACLLLARSAVRQQEIAIRLSLGAGTRRVMRQLLLESGLLAALGGMSGLAVAFGGAQLLLLAFHWQDRPIDLSPDWRVLSFSLALVVVTGLLSGLAPALQLVHGGCVALTPQQTVSPRFTSLKGLVVVEVALALVLVAGAGVFVRSFQNLRSVPIGFSADRVSVVHLSSLEHPDQGKAPYQEALTLVESVRRAPLVESAAISDLLTFDDSRISFPVAAAGLAAQARQANLLKIDGSYFETLGISVMTGRTFTSHDDENAAKVAVLSEGTARRLFAGENPLGKRILLGNVNHPKPENEVQIVGIVNDIQFSTVTAPAPDVIFQPLLQGQHNGALTSTLKLQIRGRLKPQEAAALVRAQIAELHLPVKVGSAAPLEDAIAMSMTDDRTRMQASGLFGILALLLITAGTYGMMAYSVAMRTREIGIRMVVGSRPAEIMTLVLSQSLKLVLVGVAFGLPGAIAATRAVSSLVFGLSPIDWTSLAGAALILGATAIAASIVPAWRAAQLDPMKALRVQ